MKKILTVLLLFLIIFIDINSYAFLDSLFKQNINDVSFMTNKIEHLTNSLSDPEFTGTSVNSMLIDICYAIITFLMFINFT